MNRRDFAKLIGVGAAATMMPLLRGSRTFAQPAAIPKRIIFFYNGDGNTWGYSHPRPPPGASTYDRTNFQLPESMTPLEDFKDRMILFENLDMLSHDRDRNFGSDAHSDALTHVLSSNSRFGQALTNGPTIDQLIAQDINRERPLTALSSLAVFGRPGGPLDPAGGFAGDHIPLSMVAPGEAATAHLLPEHIFNLCFPASAGGPVDISPLLARRQHIASFLRREHGRVAARVSAAERRKLETHADLLSDLDTRRALALSGGDRRVFWPDRSVIDPAMGLDFNYNAPESVWAERQRIVTDINLHLVASALHADVTRVATVLIESPMAYNYGYRAGMFGTGDWHDFTHQVNNPTPGGVLGSLRGNPEAMSLALQHNRGGFECVRNLASVLASLPEVDGSTLLDHTLIVYTSQIGHGDHQIKSLPWFTLGNIDGYFETGQLITFPTTGLEWLQPNGARRPDQGRGHGDLFVTVANAMGVPITTFGNPDVCRGPILEMLA